MIVVIGHFRLPPEHIERARPVMAQVIAASLAEAGCRAYAYAEDVREPELFRVSEVWDNRKALEAHFATGHMKQWQQGREALGFHDREVTAYEVEEAVLL
jgi:quinol monooxygenase YgiN